MILRLATVTLLLALFAFSFSVMVELENGGRGDSWSPQPMAGCFDQGAVCAPPSRS